MKKKCFVVFDDKQKIFWRMLVMALALVFGLILAGCNKCPNNGNCVAKYDAANGWVEDGCGCLQGQHSANAKCTCN
jgi:hypothetical protein